MIIINYCKPSKCVYCRLQVSRCNMPGLSRCVCVYVLSTSCLLSMTKCRENNENRLYISGWYSVWRQKIKNYIKIYTYKNGENLNLHAIHSCKLENTACVFLLLLCIHSSCYFIIFWSFWCLIMVTTIRLFLCLYYICISVMPDVFLSSFFSEK